MQKEKALRYMRECVGSDRPVKILYRFSDKNLPDVLRLHGIDDHVDVPLAAYRDRLLAISGDEVITIGRLPLCDIQADDFEDNLISRIHVIWQKVGDEYLLANCGIYGTTAFRETLNGLQEVPALDELADF